MNRSQRRSRRQCGGFTSLINGRVSTFSTGHRFPGGRLIFPALPGFADQNLGESPDFGALLQNMGERPETDDH